MCYRLASVISDAAPDFSRVNMGAAKPCFGSTLSISRFHAAGGYL